MGQGNEHGNLRADREDLGFIWDVYPSITSLPMIAQGHSGEEGRARAAVEQVLIGEKNAGWGVVIAPWGETHVCRRNRDGGFAWQPLFPEPETGAPEPGPVP